MPRLFRVPKYCRHARGTAFCKYQGKTIYLGKHGTEDSRKRYRRFLQHIERTAEAAVEPLQLSPLNARSIVEVVAAYDRFARTYYVTREGKLSKEFHSMAWAIGRLAEFCRGEPVAGFGPCKLTEFQQMLVVEGYGRSFINKTVSRIKRMFRWACKTETCPPELFHKLSCVDGLKKGFTKARENAVVAPVAPEVVDATLPFLTPTVAAMIQVQRLCGMRPSETCTMRPVDIDRTDDIWIYRPANHKNDWRGLARIIPIPKVAQAILAPLLERGAEEFVFSPRDSERWRAAQRVGKSKPNRKTPIYPSELKARERLREQRRETAFTRLRERYDRDSYRKAIEYGIGKAGRNGVALPKWFPYQLRHAIVTEVSRVLGPKAAQLWAGHEHVSTTEVYVDKQVSDVKDVARKLDSHWAGRTPASSVEQSPPATE
jgi:integrase